MAYYFLSVIFLSFIFLLSLRDATSMECEFGHESSVWDKLNILNIKSCPTIIDDPNNIYCCVNDDRVYCCSSAQFVSSSISHLLPILIAVAVGVLITCCISCLCCPCCLLYKRRHRGTVYGRVQNVGAAPQPVPAYAPQPTPMPGYSQTAAYPVYPVQAGQQPSPYNEVMAKEVYSKQAPYNPNFQ